MPDSLPRTGPALRLRPPTTPRTRLVLYVALLVVAGLAAFGAGRLVDPPLPPGVVLDVHHHA